MRPDRAIGVALMVCALGWALPRVGVLVPSRGVARQAVDPRVAELVAQHAVWLRHVYADEGGPGHAPVCDEILRNIEAELRALGVSL